MDYFAALTPATLREIMKRVKSVEDLLRLEATNRGFRQISLSEQSIWRRLYVENHPPGKSFRDGPHLNYRKKTIKMGKRNYIFKKEREERRDWDKLTRHLCEPWELSDGVQALRP